MGSHDCLPTFVRIDKLLQGQELDDILKRRAETLTTYRKMKVTEQFADVTRLGA
jgi:hypothetical protein